MAIASEISVTCQLAPLLWANGSAVHCGRSGRRTCSLHGWETEQEEGARISKATRSHHLRVSATGWGLSLQTHELLGDIQDPNYGTVNLNHEA